jgi:hypothetical protein
MTFPSGAGITLQLIPSSNRVLVVLSGTAPDEETISAAMPRLLQHLANASGLPIRRDGMTYMPRNIQDDNATTWGDQ